MAWLAWAGWVSWAGWSWGPNLQPMAACGNPYGIATLYFTCVAWLAAGLGWLGSVCRLHSELSQPAQLAQAAWLGLAGLGVRLESLALDARERWTDLPIPVVSLDHELQYPCSLPVVCQIASKPDCKHAVFLRKVSRLYQSRDFSGYHARLHTDSG